MKVGFNVKWGYNEIEIPVTDETKPKFRPYGMTDKFTDKVTIYNYMPYDGVNLLHYDRFVIDKCLIYNNVTEQADGTINKVVNTQNVITMDIEHYKSPYEYKQLAEDKRENFYTVQVDDFVVYGEVDDVVTDSQEWTALQKKYKGNGFLVTAVMPNIHGMTVDNVQITHA